MVDDESAEEPVGGPRTDQPGHALTSCAQARQIDTETESSTIAGLQRPVLKDAHRIMEFTEGLQTSTARRLADAETIARALEQLNNLTVNFH